ncbi:hypothetical protein FACS189490_01090 [Clostridia bacterium]|nr:hypothetical protein FACS189490_01090 [Clostridia bacterium]
MVRNIITAVLVVIIAISAGYIIKNRYDYSRAKKVQNLVSQAYDAEKGKQTPAPIITPSPKPVADVEETTPPAETEEKTPEDTPAPTVQPEFVTLMEQFSNNDIVGYLRIADTTIDYPVLQSSDNDYYINRNIYGQTIKSGSVFMDYENDITKEDYNTVIYGHNMHEDVMFHDLRNFTDKKYWETHRYVTFNTLYEDMTWEIFTFYEIDFNDFFYYRVNFNNSEEFSALASEMKAKSMYDTGVQISPGDRVLTLSTCTNEQVDMRFVLGAKLVKNE